MENKKAAWVEAACNIVEFLLCPKLWHGAVNVVPKWGRNPKSLVAVLVMVDAVVHPKRFENVFGRAESMHDVMHQQVRGITYNKARKKTEGVISHNQVKQAEKRGGKQKAYRNRHGQPFFVFGVVMVHPVEVVLDLFLEFGIGNHVEDITVHVVFHPGKKQKTDQESPARAQQGEPSLLQSDGHHYRSVDKKQGSGYGNVRSRQKVKQTVVEQIGRFGQFGFGLARLVGSFHS